MVSPFRLAAYDRDLAYRGHIARPLAVEATPRHMATPTATFTLAADHPRSADLLAEGARVVIEYQGRFLMSGRVDSFTAAGPSKTATRTFSVLGDFQTLGEVLAWQVPTAPITGQGAAEYQTLTGPAESVVKTLLTRNAVTRLGIPLTVAPDLARGSTIQIAARMHTVADRVVTLADRAGIGLTVAQHDGALVVDAYTPRTVLNTLTERTGMVLAWSHQHTAPTLTRVVVGCGGEGTARIYRRFIDAARETALGTVIEAFVDARDIAPDDPELEALAAARGAAALAEGAGTSGIAVTLGERAWRRYGESLQVGDRVRVDIGGGQTITDVLRSAKLEWKTTSGLSVEPQIGTVQDDPDQVYADAIRATAARVSRLSVER